MYIRSHNGPHYTKVYVLLENISSNIPFVECMVLLDGRSSLAGIAASSFDQLLDCSLSTRSAGALTEFFHQDAFL